MKLLFWILISVGGLVRSKEGVGGRGEDGSGSVN